MGDLKISTLPTDVTTLASGDKFPIADVSNAGVDTFATTLEIANYVVSGLTAASAAAAANEIPINEAGTSKKITITQLITLLQTALGLPVLKTLASQYTNSTTTGTSVTGLRFDSLVAGNYYVKWVLLMQSVATTTSWSLGINYTGTVTRFSAWTLFPSAGVTAATGTMHDANNATTGQVVAYANTHTESTTTPNMGPWVGTTNANQNHLIIVEAMLVVSDGGNLELYAASEVGASQMSIEIGSSGMLIRTA